MTDGEAFYDPFGGAFAVDGVEVGLWWDVADGDASGEDDLGLVVACGEAHLVGEVKVVEGVMARGAGAALDGDARRGEGIFHLGGEGVGEVDVGEASAQGGIGGEGFGGGGEGDAREALAEVVGIAGAPLGIVEARVDPEEDIFGGGVDANGVEGMERVGADGGATLWGIEACVGVKEIALARCGGGVVVEGEALARANGVKVGDAVSYQTREIIIAYAAYADYEVLGGWGGEV